MESSNAGVVRWQPSIPRRTRLCKPTKDVVNIGDIMGVVAGSPLKAL